MGGLPYDLSEGDIITIFSQFGEPVHLNLVRDKETGKSRGFAFLKYEDQRSTDLAVDNLGGATVLGRLLRVDHVRYKRRDDEGEDDNVTRLLGEGGTDAKGEDSDDLDGRRRRKVGRGNDEDEDEDAVGEEQRRPLLREEMELIDMMRNHDNEDPMKEFLIEEKKEEVTHALERFRVEEKEKKSRHQRDDGRHRRHHRHKRHHGHHRSRSREKTRHERRLPSRERTSYRDESPRERSYRDGSRSRSPESRKRRERSDRHR